MSSKSTINVHAEDREIRLCFFNREEHRNATSYKQVPEISRVVIVKMFVCVQFSLGNLPAWNSGFAWVMDFNGPVKSKATPGHSHNPDLIMRVSF